MSQNGGSYPHGRQSGRTAIPSRCRIVYRYTGGHPVAVGVLLDAVVGQRETDLAAVLNGSGPGSTQRKQQQPVADLLLDRLLSGIPAGHIADLVICSAARDKEAALRLAEESGLLKRPSGAKAEIFGARFWRESPAGPGLVLHPVLRRLLLRRLAARPAESKANWTTVHAWLRENARATGDQAGELHHALALMATTPAPRIRTRPDRSRPRSRSCRRSSGAAGRQTGAAAPWPP